MFDLFARHKLQSSGQILYTTLHYEVKLGRKVRYGRQCGRLSSKVSTKVDR